MRQRRLALLELIPLIEAETGDDALLEEIRETAKVEGAGNKAHLASSEVNRAGQGAAQSLRGTSIKDYREDPVGHGR